MAGEVVCTLAVVTWEALLGLAIMAAVDRAAAAPRHLWVRGLDLRKDGPVKRSLALRKMKEKKVRYHNIFMK